MIISTMSDGFLTYLNDKIQDILPIILTFFSYSQYADTMHLMLQIYTIILIADTKIDSEFKNLEINKSYLLFGVMVSTPQRTKDLVVGKKKKKSPAWSVSIFQLSIPSMGSFPVSIKEVLIGLSQVTMKVASIYKMLLFDALQQLGYDIALY